MTRAHLIERGSAGRSGGGVHPGVREPDQDTRARGESSARRPRGTTCCTSTVATLRAGPLRNQRYREPVPALRGGGMTRAAKPLVGAELPCDAAAVRDQRALPFVPRRGDDLARPSGTARRGCGHRADRGVLLPRITVLGHEPPALVPCTEGEHRHGGRLNHLYPQKIAP